MRDAGPGTHALHVASTDHGTVAKTVPVFECTNKYVCDDLHVLVSVRRKASTGDYAVFIYDP
jgi:hypothetical protein